MGAIRLLKVSAEILVISEHKYGWPDFWASHATVLFSYFAQGMYLLPLF